MDIQSLQSKNGEVIFEGTELCEHINDYFAGIGSKLSSDIMQSNMIDPEAAMNEGPSNLNSDNISNNVITTMDLENIKKKI